MARALRAPLLTAAALLFARAGAKCSSAISKGELTIHGAGSGAVLVGSGGRADGDAITIEHNAGFSVFSDCQDEWKAESIAQFKLLGHEISFTVDLKHVGCACNLAFYLISMPARDIRGDFNPGDNRGGQPRYYCDANMVGGQWCPEIDIMEANDHAFQATPHNCESPENGHYSYCDRAGCAENTRSTDGAYGPGDRYQIDTTRRFRVRTEFFEEGGSFAGMRTTLLQDARKVVLDHQKCDRRYLSKLTDALADGMSLRITYWGESADTMAWLDQPPCGGSSCEGEKAGPATISNITVAKLKHSGMPVDGAPNDPHSVPQKWVSDEWAPWECHHYTGNQQETQWCATAGFEGGYEYKYTGGLGNLCGVCWCCKRKAKLVAEAPPTTPVPQWQWQPPTTTQKAEATQPRAPSLYKESLTIVGMPGAWLAGEGASADGDKIRIGHNSGVSVFNAKIEEWDAQHIAEFKLLGKTLSFTVDLSQVGCACNLALYLISMPAMDVNGKPSAGTNRGGQPAFYCDANQVGGQWCPEIDIMEANNHAFQSTLHRCDAPRHRHYDFCDRGGCAQNTRERSGAYGPGSQHSIDTMRPFDVETEFLTKGGALSGMRTTLKQRDQRVVLDHSDCNEGYLAKLTDAMKYGMSLRVTYWGDQAQTMAWMDIPPCDWNGCSGENAGHAVISDIRVTSAGENGPEAWVVADPKDKLFGQLVPEDVIENAESFKVLHDQGVAEWDHVRHFVRHMKKQDIDALVREAAQEEKRQKHGAAAPSAPLPFAGLPAMPSLPPMPTLPPMQLLTLPPPPPPPQAPVIWTAVVARYSPFRLPALASAGWPLQIALFAAAVALMGCSSVLAGRRMWPSPRRREDEDDSRGRVCRRRRGGLTFERAPLVSPGGVSPLSGSRIEAPSPMRRPSRASQLPSPPTGSKLEFLQRMEACIE